MRAKFSKDDKKDVLYEGRFLRFVKRGEWEYVERNNCTGIVIIIAMNKDQKVILIEQFRPPVNGSVIEFPAGLVGDHPPKEGETINDELMEDAAIRELFEETGYEAGRMECLLEGPVNGGSSSNLVHIFRGYDLEKIGRGGGDETESIIVHEVPLEGVNEWLLDQQKQGKLIEPKVYAGLYFLKEYSKF